MFDHAVSATFTDTIGTPWTLATVPDIQLGEHFTLTIGNYNAVTVGSFAKTFEELRQAIRAREECTFSGFPGGTGDFVCDHLAFNLNPNRHNPAIRCILASTLLDLINALEAKYEAAVEAAKPKAWMTIQPNTFYRLYVPYCANRGGIWYVGKGCAEYDTLRPEPIRSFTATGPNPIDSPCGTLYGDIIVFSGYFAQFIIPVDDEYATTYITKNFPNG